MSKDKKTPVFDWDRMEFKKGLNGAVKTVKGNAAVEEVFFKAQQTRRGQYVIYANPEDPDQHHKYGNDLLNVIRANLVGRTLDSEAKRAVIEAGKYLTGVKNVYRVEVEQGVNDELHITAIVTTDYNDKLPIEGIIDE